MKKFIEKSWIDKALIKAVIKQIGGFGYFRDCACDIANHGIDGGYHGFIYYFDTVKFTEDNLPQILAMAKYQATDYGHGTYIDFMVGFRCFKNLNQSEILDGLHSVGSDFMVDVYNGIAWYAGEEVARAYCYMIEEATYNGK